MRTRYGVSPWIHTYPTTRRPQHPKLRGEHAATVAIVGGGLTGCAIAYACATAGIKAVVIEADRIGQAGAGRGAGLLLPEPGPSFRDLAQVHGRRTARRIFEGWRRASLDAAAIIRRLNVRCGLEPRDNIQIAFGDEQKLLRREHDARDQAGVDVRWLTQRQIRNATSLDAAAGLRLHDAFVLDPYRACLGVAAAAVRRGSRIFERSPVRKVRVGARHVEVVLEGGMVRADRVVIATGTATAEFKPLQRHFKRRERYLVLTEPVPAAVRKQIGARELTLRDMRTPRHLIRWTNDDRMLVAGADQDVPPPRRRDAVLVQRTGQLMYEALTMFPVISGLQPEYGWELGYGDTADGVMYIGPHRNYPRHLFALGGSDSMTGAFLAARVLVRALRGEPDKADEAFGWTR